MKKDREFLLDCLVIYALMEWEARELGELHHAHRCEQCCQAIDNMLEKLP